MNYLHFFFSVFFRAKSNFDPKMDSHSKPFKKNHGLEERTFDRNVIRSAVRSYELSSSRSGPSSFLHKSIILILEMND